MSAMETTPASTENDKAPLELADTICIIIGIVIGVVAFNSPRLVFGSAANEWSAVAAWAFGGLLALIGALCYAELATTYPRAGGDYNYLTRSYGAWVGFLFGWAQLVILMPAAIGTMAIVFADFASAFFDITKVAQDDSLLANVAQFMKDNGLSTQFVYGGLVVVVLTLLNLLGVRLGKWTQIILTLGKFGGLIAIIVAGFWLGTSTPDEWKAKSPDVKSEAKAAEKGQPNQAPNQPAVQAPNPPTHWDITWGSLAIILIMYAYGGWNDAAFVAAEVRNPRRNIPLALVISVSVITVLYIALNMSYITGLGFAEVKKFDGEKLPNAIMNKMFDLKIAKATPPAPNPVGKGKGDGKGGKGQPNPPENQPPVPAANQPQPAMSLAATIISIIIMISALGAANGLIFTGARVYSVLGNDHALFTWLGHWRPGRGSPILSLIAQMIFALALLLVLGTDMGRQFVNSLFDGINSLIESVNADYKINYSGGWEPKDAFESLFIHSAPIFWIFFLLAGMSLFVLRSKNPNRERPFSVPLFPLLPIIFCNSCAYMLYQATIYVGWRALLGIALVALGIPLYFLSRMIGYRGEVET